MLTDPEHHLTVPFSDLAKAAEAAWRCSVALVCSQSSQAYSSLHGMMASWSQSFIVLFSNGKAFWSFTLARTVTAANTMILMGLCRPLCCTSPQYQILLASEGWEGVQVVQHQGVGFLPASAAHPYPLKSMPACHHMSKGYEHSHWGHPQNLSYEL